MKFTRLVIGAFALLLLLPIKVAAENIGNVEPTSWDYGEVELDSSESMTFSFESIGPVTALSVSGIFMLDDSGAFQIVSVIHVESGTELPAPYHYTLPLDEHMEIEVEFTPTYAGMFASDILIASNAINFPSYYIPIQGEGVVDEPTPGELMEDVIAMFDDCVAAGSLYGVGNGNSDVAHLRVFDGMLDSADDLIGLGDYDAACDQLGHAGTKSDGWVPPPDFIGGACASTVNDMIGEVMTTLGCE